MNYPANSTILKRTLLALALGTVSNGLIAQDTTDDATEYEGVLEEVIVTGMRASLEDSLNRKRMSDQMVDAITSEDIGKLPDDNIGEALQRIPGLTLDREAGEGKGVGVRGLGADLSIVTINGQQMASTEGSREFNFSVLDASIVSALEVWKSPMARQDEGAVGGTINIQTRGPLDYKTTKINLSAAGQYEELTEKWGGKYTGNIFWQNEDQTFGLGLAANYSDRVTRSDQVIIPGWTQIDSAHKDWKSRGWDDLAEEHGLDYLFYPIDASSRIRLYDRQRTGINPTLQWRPSDKLELNVYGFYSKLEDYDINQSSQVRIRDLVRGGGRDVNDYEWEFDGPIAVYFDATDANIKGSWRAYRQAGTLRENEWISKGVNTTADYQLNDTINLYFAVGTNTGSGDKLTYPVTDFRDAVGFSVDLREDILFPQTIINGGGTDDSLMELRGLSINNQFDEEEKNYIQFDFTKDVGWGDIFSIQGGIKYKSDSTDHTVVRHTDSGEGIDGQTLADFALMCGDSPCRLSSTYEHDTLAPLNGTFTMVDLNLVMDTFPLDGRGTETRYNESFLVEEDTIAAYIQANLEGEIFNIDYRGNFGVRFYETDLTSSGWLDRAGTISGTVERSYNDWLPSANFVFILQEDLMLRMGLGKVMARPNQEDLALAGTYNLEQETARVGNPFLDPFEAITADLGIEWYFSDVGLISAAVFYKDISSFISNGKIPGGVPVDTGNGIVLFDATGPINGDSGTVKGFEIGYQQLLSFLPSPFDGFGLQINYTYTDSDVSIPYFEGDQEFSMPLEGLSEDSMNFILFWESDRFSVRTAYNYRSEFLSNRSNTQGNPAFTDEYGQWDASANWFFNKRFTLSLNAININDEARYQYFLTPDRMLAHRASGRRFSVGLRYRF